jgi:hypothetical protein
LTLSGTTVRIRQDTRRILRELEEQTGQGPQALLALAVERLRRTLILSESNAAYAGYASAEPASELQEWEATLADGLEDE